MITITEALIVIRNGIKTGELLLEVKLNNRTIYGLLNLCNFTDIEGNLINVTADELESIVHDAESCKCSGWTSPEEWETIREQIKSIQPPRVDFSK